MTNGETRFSRTLLLLSVIHWTPDSRWTCSPSKEIVFRNMHARATRVIRTRLSPAIRHVSLVTVLLYFLSLSLFLVLSLTLVFVPAGAIVRTRLYRPPRFAVWKTEANGCRKQFPLSRSLAIEVKPSGRSVKSLASFKKLLPEGCRARSPARYTRDEGEIIAPIKYSSRFLARSLCFNLLS